MGMVLAHVFSATMATLRSLWGILLVAAKMFLRCGVYLKCVETGLCGADSYDMRASWDTVGAFCFRREGIKKRLLCEKHIIEH